MFSIFKRKEKEEAQVSPIVEETTTTSSWFSRLKAGLRRTRENFGTGLSRLILGKKQIDEELFEEIQAQLLMADVGISATEKMLDHLTQGVSRKELNDPGALLGALKNQLTALLEPVSQPLAIKPFSETGRTFVILVVGVNGSGKTTTLGKMAHLFKKQGYSVMLAAGDTFRAAAVEQLQAWGARNDVAVVAQGAGADSASVIFDALSSAQARKIDILLADTAGRLHTQNHLMRELQKIVRVIKKLDPEAPQETLLVLDSGIGQNALNQVEQFHQAMNLTGLTMTKLDGTAKGGIIFALAEKNHIPVRFIGVGESIDDLKPFSGKEFVSALFEEE
jgi:fused signal recognition particle receptor